MDDPRRSAQGELDYYGDVLVACCEPHDIGSRLVFHTDWNTVKLGEGIVRRAVTEADFLARKHRILPGYRPPPQYDHFYAVVAE